jgi:hypothetical protein
MDTLFTANPPHPVEAAGADDDRSNNNVPTTESNESSESQQVTATHTSKTEQDATEQDATEQDATEQDATEQTKEQEDDQKARKEQEMQEDAAIESYITKGGLSSTTNATCRFQRTARIGDDYLPVPLPDQLICAIQLAAPSNLPTKASSCMFRIVGLFESREQLEMHVEKLKSKTNIFALPTAEPFSFGTHVFETNEHYNAYIANVLKKFELNVARKHQEFDEYVEKRKSNDPEVRKALNEEERRAFKEQKTKSVAATEALLAGAKQFAEAIKPDIEAAKVVETVKLTQKHDVRGQKYAVISLVCDDDEVAGVDAALLAAGRPQWVMVVWAAFDDVKSANAYVSDTLQHEHRFLNHYIVDMYNNMRCDGIYHKDFKKSVKMIFPYQEQQDLWSSASNNKASITSYKKITAQQNTADALRQALQNDAQLSARASQKPVALR